MLLEQALIVDCAIFGLRERVSVWKGGGLGNNQKGSVIRSLQNCLFLSRLNCISKNFDYFWYYLLTITVLHIKAKYKVLRFTSWAYCFFWSFLSISLKIYNFLLFCCIIWYISLGLQLTYFCSFIGYCAFLAWIFYAYIFLYVCLYFHS